MDTQEKDKAPSALFAEAQQAVSAWLSTQGEGQEWAAQLSQHLLSGLYTERTAMPRAWQVSEPSSRLVNLNESILVVSAWAHISPKVAEALFRGVFSRQQPDGSLPARFNLDTEEADTIAPWPLLAQTALTLEEINPSSKTIKESLPAIHSYLTWVLQWYTLTTARAHAFTSAEEAFIPQEMDEGLAQLELTCMLLGELEAWNKLNSLYPSTGLVTHWLEQQHGLLKRNLQVLLWSEVDQRFAHRVIGSSEMREAACEVVAPLAWSHLPAEHREELLSQLPTLDLASLNRAGPTACAVIALLLKRARVPLPASLTEQLVFNPTRLPSSHAEWVWPLLDKAPLDPDRIKGRLAWFEQHRFSITTCFVVILVGFFLTLFMGTGLKKNLNSKDYSALRGLADTYVNQGKYEEAIALYDELGLKTTKLRSLEIGVQKGHVLFKAGRPEEALTLYETALEGGFVSPSLLLNRGHVLRQQGHYEQSIASYRQLIETYPFERNGLTLKAKKALSYVEEQLAESTKKMENK